MYQPSTLINNAHTPAGFYAVRGRHVNARSGKRQSKDAIRGVQKAWIEDVLRFTRKPASQLATDAGLSDTTITRFLNDDEHTSALSALTVSRIAESVGVAPPGGDAPTGFREDATPYDAGEPAPANDGPRVLEAWLAAHPDASPWLMRSDVLALAGVRQGDVIIVDMAITPREGDVVCAQIYEGMNARTVFRIWQQPYIVGAPLGGGPVRPELVDGRRVVIRGVMVQLIRRRSER